VEKSLKVRRPETCAVKNSYTTGEERRGEGQGKELRNA